MLHAGALACTEREECYHRPVQQVGGEESHTAGGGGSVGEFREGLLGLQGTSGNSHLVQVSETGYDGREDDWPAVTGNLRKTWNS